MLMLQYIVDDFMMSAIAQVSLIHVNILPVFRRFRCLYLCFLDRFMRLTNLAFHFYAAVRRRDQSRCRCQRDQYEKKW